MRLLVSVLMALSILTTGPVRSAFGQARKALEHPASEEWLRKKIAKMPEDIVADEAIIRYLSSSHKKLKEVLSSIGSREIRVERYFIRTAFLAGRFEDDPQKDFQWRLMMTDAVVIGTVKEVKQETEICGYGTEVRIAVERYLKGVEGDEMVVIKLASGRIFPDGRRRLVLHEPKFRVGERVLVFLIKTPFKLHDQLTMDPCPDNMELWYMTETDGSYFELGVMWHPKYTIENEKLEWQRNESELSSVVEEIVSAQKAKF